MSATWVAGCADTSHIHGRPQDRQCTLHALVVGRDGVRPLHVGELGHLLGRERVTLTSVRLVGAVVRLVAPDEAGALRAEPEEAGWQPALDLGDGSRALAGSKGLGRGLLALLSGPVLKQKGSRIWEVRYEEGCPQGLDSTYMHTRPRIDAGYAPTCPYRVFILHNLRSDLVLLLRGGRSIEAVQRQQIVVRERPQPLWVDEDTLCRQIWGAMRGPVNSSGFNQCLCALINSNTPGHHHLHTSTDTDRPVERRSASSSAEGRL